MCKILCSTGALLGGPNKRNFRLLKNLKSQLFCDGFEFMMYNTWYDQIDELTDFLQNLNIDIPVVHCEKAIGEIISIGNDIPNALKLFEENCRISDEIGAKKIVLHLWNGIVSDNNFENNLFTYPKLKDIAQKHNIDLMIENVVCNCENPMQRMLQLKEFDSDVHFVFDTKMAAFHGELELLYSDKFSQLTGNIKHYHINDYGGGFMDWSNLKTLPIGKGKIDFNRFFDFIKKSKYKDTFTVESTAFDQSGNINIAMLNEEFQTLRSFLT